MNFTEYQTKARSTAIYPETHTIIYPALGLAGEVGEVCEKIKKAIRDDGGVFTEDRRNELTKELGDVLWYFAALCTDLGVSMEFVAAANIVKLIDRVSRDKIHGEGDNR